MNNDDLQKAIDAQLVSAKKDPKSFSKSDLDNIVLTPDETKIPNLVAREGLNPQKKLSGEGGIAEEIKTVDLDTKEFESVKDHPKTIAQMLSLEAKVAQNPPSTPRPVFPSPSKNVRPNIPPPGIGKVQENLKDISYVSNESPIVKKLRTFQGDIQEAMLSGKATLTSIAVAESNRKVAESRTPKVEERHESTPKQSSSFGLKFLTLFLGLLLVLSGGFAVWYTKFFNKELLEVVETNDKNAPLITSQFEVPINIDRKNASYIKAAVAAERKRGAGSLNDIGIIYLMRAESSGEKAVNTEEFVQALEMRMPAELLRTLSPNFMLGIHRFPESQSFLIFQTDSYDRARASMLEWESFLEEDVGKLLRSSTDLAYENTSEEATNRRLFKDETIKNQDTRALYNEKGEILFFYTFLKDRQTIIFTTSGETLVEIIGGLSSRKVVQ